MEKLPTLKEVLSGDIAQIKRHNDLNIILNAPPKNDWVQKHPIIKKEVTVNGQKVRVPLEYMTIERVEYLLTAIFGRWRTEVRECKLIANSVTVTVRLFYFNPVSGEWDFQDGVGAVPLQTNSGAGAIDFNKIKSDAVQKGAPAAESFAIKDAAHKIGKIFGKELNRRDDIDYQGALGRKFETKEQLQREISNLLAGREGDERDSILSDMMEKEAENADTYEYYISILEKLQ